TLPETLACVYGQTFLQQYPGGFELIVVNDASKDGSLKMLRAEAAAHPEILTVIDLPENRGPGGARNAGLDAAEGEYIGFLDSDDTIDPTVYEKLYRAATAGEGYDIADCGIIDDNQGGAVLYYVPAELAGKLTPAGKNLLISEVGYLWNRIYRRRLLQEPKIRFRERMVMEDLDFLSEVFARAESVTVVPETLYRYHDLPDSASKRDAEVAFFENTILAMRAVHDRLAALPDHEAYRPGAEYTYCKLAAATWHTIDGYVAYGAVTPDLAKQMRDILRAELQKLVRIPIDGNPITATRMEAADRELLRREIKGKKKLLFVTHQLSLSGAPLVLLSMIRCCREMGYEAEVISYLPGDLSGELDALQIPWSVCEDLLKDWQSFYQKAQTFDAVIVNTLVAWQAVMILNHTTIPTCWWLHETEEYFADYDAAPDMVPRMTDLKPNIRLLPVSPLVREILRKRYGLKREAFPFFVEDRDAPQAGAADDKVRFLTLGMYEPRKGQDVLAEAILLLPEDIRERCEFLLYGGRPLQHPDFRRQVEERLRGYETVKFGGSIPHEEAMRIMDACDFCIVPSREEPFSAVTIEAMVVHKPTILTDICGVADYLKDGENALFCPPEDAQALSDRISEAVRIRREDPDRYRQMGDAARAVYDA
ncbi:MAG: glycosyltransferase, partial [Lachnospiraceae bacterium]|nr:glycosyltransferase [Lachnospiraceae bacterium]